MSDLQFPPCRRSDCQATDERCHQPEAAVAGIAGQKPVDGKTAHSCGRRYATSRTVRQSLMMAAMLLSLGTKLLGQDAREIAVRRTPDKIRYGLIPDVQTPSAAPTLFIFAHGIEDMRKQPVYTEVAAILAAKGWVSVIVEPPCHGEDQRQGEPPQLQGWRHRLDQQEDFIAAFTAKASAILDHVIEQKITDPNRVAACGTSRGGFLAGHFAAADPRVKAVGGLSPVTRLTALSEFTTTPQRERAEALNLANLGEKLAGRAVWLSIGNSDARVNTDDAIAFTRAVVKANSQPDNPNQVIPVELIVAPARGHSKIDQAHDRLAEWLIKNVP